METIDLLLCIALLASTIIAIVLFLNPRIRERETRHRRADETSFDEEDERLARILEDRRKRESATSARGLGGGRPAAVPSSGARSSTPASDPYSLSSPMNPLYHASSPAAYGSSSCSSDYGSSSSSYDGGGSSCGGGGD